MTGVEAMEIYDRYGRVLEELQHPEGARLAYRDALRVAEQLGKTESADAKAIRARLEVLEKAP